MSTARCIAVQGFKREGHRGLIAPGAELELPTDEFDRLQKAGAVADLATVQLQQEEDAAARLRLLSEHYRRPPSDRELADMAYVPIDRLAETLAAQQKAQAEFEAARADRDARRLAYEQQKAQVEEDRHQKLADRARNKRPKVS